MYSGKRPCDVLKERAYLFLFWCTKLKDTDGPKYNFTWTFYQTAFLTKYGSPQTQFCSLWRPNKNSIENLQQNRTCQPAASIWYLMNCKGLNLIPNLMSWKNLANQHLKFPNYLANSPLCKTGRPEWWPLTSHNVTFSNLADHQTLCNDYPTIVFFLVCLHGQKILIEYKCVLSAPL